MITQLDTVFQLRRDNLEKWENSERVLKPGELALAYTDVETLVDNQISSVPVVLLKAGELVENSIKTFNELPFVSALAADVSNWAKQSGITIEYRNDGDVVSDVTWENDKLVFTMTTLPTPVSYEASNGVKRVDNTFVANFDFASTLDQNRILQIIDRTTHAVIADFDASQFLLDGMLEDVDYDADTNNLTFTWNLLTEDGKNKKTQIINLSDIIDPYDAGKGIVINGTTISHIETTSAVSEPRKVGRDDLGHVVLGDLLVKADVGLSLVDNKSTSMIKTEFTGAIEKDNVGFVTGNDAYEVHNALRSDLDNVKNHVCWKSF